MQMIKTLTCRVSRLFGIAASIKRYNDWLMSQCKRPQDHCVFSFILLASLLKACSSSKRFICRHVSE